MSHSRCALAVCGLLAVVFAGCGKSSPKLYPATGTVTFEDKPVEGASVMFIPPGGRPSMGTTDASGKYTIATLGKPGAPTGTYHVTVAKTSAGATDTGNAAAMPAVPSAEPSDEEKQKMMEKQREAMQAMTTMMQSNSKPPANALPDKYAVPEGSGLKAVVTDDASKNVFDFPLTP